MEQLFLLEVVVDTIYFQSVAMVPQKKQIIIVATFGNLVTLEIRTDSLGALEHTSESKRKDIEINFGKSYLFFAKPDDLINAMDKCPLEVVISTKASPTPIANATINWESDFDYMLSSCNNNVGYMTPAFQCGFYEIKHKDVVVGNIDLFVRLSCFGKSISTNMQIVRPPKDTKEGAPVSTKFLVKSANAATTYECQIYGMGTSQEFLPVAPMYQSVDVPSLFAGLKPYDRQRSTETINLESRVPSVFVMDMPVRDFDPVDLKTLADLLTGHRESMIVRPDEMPFTNLEQLMELKMEDVDENKNYSGRVAGSITSSVNLTNLTVESIERQLCKSKDCPAARMFKDYGIGPLATGKALGTVINRDEVKIPTTYGLTETFGHNDRYGPFGLYSRPKHPNEPFIARDSHSSIKKSSSDSTDKCKKSCKHSCNKLKGGRVKDVLIRLRGGGIPNLQIRVEEEGPDFINLEDDRATYLSKFVRLRAGGKGDDEHEDNSPMYKCRELMHEFDKVVSAYKKALGPCGKAICPFAQNVMIEKCRQACPGSTKTDETSDSMTLSSCHGPEDGMSACLNDTCEFRRHDDNPVADEFRKSQLKSACGDPSCAYVKQRLGCPDELDDGGVKLHELPRNCGGPKCPYSAMDPLPPIHWDCPDPLPKGGICHNRDCPIARKQHLIDCSFKAPKPPCGQGSCPYTPPAPCDFKGCPFGPLIDPCPSFCPYKRDPCPRKCPYALEEPTEPCFDMTCPYNMAAVDVSPVTPKALGATDECYHGPGGHSPNEPCGNPNCPYNDHDFVADDEDDDDLVPCDASTCKAASGGPYECDHCVAAGGAKSMCSCNANDRGQSQADRSTDRNKKHMEPHRKKGSDSNVHQVYTSKSTPRKRSKEVEPPMEKIELAQDPNNNTRGQTGHNSVEPNPPSHYQASNQQRLSSNQQVIAPINQQQQPTSGRVVPPGSNSGHHKRKRKHRTQFIYDEGDTYPGIHVGHKFCNMPQLNVPKNMGWLWNIKTHVGRLKHRRGWRPGAISKTIAARIEEHRRLLGILPPDSQKPSRRRMKKKKDGTYGGYESESEEEISPKPTLLIKKKDGCYWITMNPLKDPATLEENENPYIDCTPMQFKIAANKIENGNKDEAKSCFCGDDDINVGAVGPEESDSELDIEFTPPAGIIHPERHRRKRNIVHIDTQYDMNDFLPPRLQLEAKKSSEGEKKGKGKKGKGKKGKKGKKKKK